MMQETDGAEELENPQDKLVLLVDDDESLLDLMDHVVKKEGFRVERASNGQEAVLKARDLHPHLIVLDFMLPGLGGFEALRELQSGETSGIPILVITGRRMDRQTVDLIRQESNVREFMEKPLRPALLCSLIHRILRTSSPGMRRAADQESLSGP